MKYDLIVIGAGAGGLTAAVQARALNLSVALIEKEQCFGGDCLHYGCVPSKSLISGSKKVRQVRMFMDDKGIAYNEDIIADGVFKKVADDVAYILEHHDKKEIYINKGIDIFDGVGSIVDQTHVKVEGNDHTVLNGDIIIIATGSRPFVPPIAGLRQANYATNETIFSRTEAPKTMVVIGGGPIGLELGQAFSNLGTDVTVVEAKRNILPNEDEELAHYVQQYLDKDMCILTDATVESVVNEDGQKVVVQLKGEKKRINAQLILVASGRRANIEALNLDVCGIDNYYGKIKTDGYLRTNFSNIYAVGDVNEYPALTHTANLEAKIAVENAFKSDKFYGEYEPQSTSYMVFTAPQVYRNGVNKRQADKKYAEGIKTIRLNLSHIDRYIVDDCAYGYVEVVLNLEDKIIGISAVGEDIGEYLQELAYIMQHGLKLDTIMKVVHPYPGYCEVCKAISEKYINGIFV